MSPERAIGSAPSPAEFTGRRGTRVAIRIDVDRSVTRIEVDEGPGGVARRFRTNRPPARATRLNREIAERVGMLPVQGDAGFRAQHRTRRGERERDQDEESSHGLLVQLHGGALRSEVVASEALIPARSKTVSQLGWIRTW